MTEDLSLFATFSFIVPVDFLYTTFIITSPNIH
jgi:hypothetical protein